MNWNNPEIKPPVSVDSGWMTESKPVLCKVSYSTEDEISEEVKIHESICVCTFNTYKDGSSKWEPIIDHLSVSTMPCADWSIEPGEAFTVLSWTEIQ